MNQPPPQFQPAPGGAPPPFNQQQPPPFHPQPPLPLGPTMQTPVQPIQIPPHFNLSVKALTLYLTNLNEKMKLPVMERTLKTLFGVYGEVRAIVMHANVRMRGQAFVVFTEQDDADRALKEVQGLVLYNKPLMIQYAKSKSDATAKFDGTWEEHKAQRDEEKARRDKEPRAKRQKMGLEGTGLGGQMSTMAPQAGFQPMAMADDYLPPNKILFLQNLPAEATYEMLETLFQQYPGFKEVRLVPGKKDLAFVEYNSDLEAAAAKQQMNCFKFTPEHDGIKVTFARR